MRVVLGSWANSVISVQQYQSEVILRRSFPAMNDLESPSNQGLEDFERLAALSWTS